MLDFNRETRLSLPQVDASNVLFRDAKAPPAAPGDAANMPETLSLAPANRSGLQQLKTECANWLTNNIANPAYNALYVNNRRMLGDLTGSDWLKSVQAAEVKPGGTLEYCAQHLSSGLAGVIPYALAGKLVGGVSRALAGTIGLTGMPARLMASETMAQISGAAAYDSLRTPGEHETRWGNALAGATAFGIFEGGNHLFKTASFIPRIAGRALTGYTGGGVQMAIAEGSAVTSQQLSEAAQSGAFLNVFLPPVQRFLAPA